MYGATEFTHKWCYTGFQSACPYQARHELGFETLDFVGDKEQQLVQKRLVDLHPSDGNKTIRVHSYASFWPCPGHKERQAKVLKEATIFCSWIRWTMVLAKRTVAWPAYLAWV